jgi:uncharacterized membrane protein YbhN (UPF0104 family)
MNGHGGLQSVHAALRFLWMRIAWNRIGVAVSLCIIATAAAVLYRCLRGINAGDVLAALWATKPSRLAQAAAAVAGAYFTLTLYDFFALRTLGFRTISYTVAARAGFASYAIGHNIGAATFTGAAVRYRVYSAHALDSIAVAKVCFLAALTFWLGNVSVLGLGVALEPDAATAIDRLPPVANRALALLALCGIAAYLAWVWRTPRTLGRGPWRVRLPNGPLTLLQIAIGAVDLMCCALAMYLLLPGASSIGFVTLAVMFVSAMLLGLASHAPGGIGVLEATMLIALPQLDKRALLGALLLFRLLYYIAPLILSLLMLGTREALVALTQNARGRAREDAVAEPATSRCEVPSNLLD